MEAKTSFHEACRGLSGLSPRTQLGDEPINFSGGSHRYAIHRISELGTSSSHLFVTRNEKSPPRTFLRGDNPRCTSHCLVASDFGFHAYGTMRTDNSGWEKVKNCTRRGS